MFWSKNEKTVVYVMSKFVKKLYVMWNEKTHLRSDFTFFIFWDHLLRN